MLKPKTVSLEDSNVAGIGGDLDKKLREMAAAGEPAWAKAGKVPGLEIWRIEKFKVVAVPPKSYGSFYTGDSYIVLNTYKKKDSDALAWDVHFWLGLSTTQDEAGTAAYKTVELDDHLNGAPIEHREVQDNESPLFLSYFPKGVRLMEGGMDSGFTHVGPKEYKPRLLHLKGKKNVRLREVPMTLDSVNSGDVFILDLGMKLVQFNGKSSGPMERAKAAQICRLIDEERSGNPQVIVFDEHDKVFPKEWTDILTTGAIKSAAEGGDDLAYEKGISKRVLIRLSDASGALTMTEVAKDAAVKPALLDQNDVFIVDLGREVFCWIGSGASKDERAKGMQFAGLYLKEHGLPPATPISRVISGAESSYFWQAAFNC